MENHFFISALIASCFVLTNLHANEIRLYQESDHATLRGMLADNEDLLVLGDDFNIRVSETERYLDSANYTTQVYIKNNEPVAFITYTKNAFKAQLVDSNDPTKIRDAVPHGAIQLLSVQKKYHRQGIGTALLETAVKDMKSKKVETIFLQTKVANTASCSLYEKNGFKLMFTIVPGIHDCFYRLLL